MANTKVYFPNLNPIRFIAALLIFIYHTEQIKDFGGLPNFFNTTLLHNLGEQSVILFFTLSGFLITYLLLVEEHNTKTVNIKAFYFRRMLKIWPLYFAIIALAFFLFPALVDLPDYSINSFGKNLILHIAFLPNLALVLYGLVPMASQTWTIGTEEQFYIFWPWIFKLKFNKYLTFLAIIVGYLLVKFGLKYLPENSYVLALSGFWNLFNIDCMAIGGLFALLLFEKQRILSFIFNRYFQWLIYCCTGLLFFFPGIPEVFSILFSIIILNLGANPRSVISLDLKPLDFLGRISYGIYMYHIGAIIVVAKALESFNQARSIYIYPLSFGLTVIIASLSYRYFEARFISLKRRFTKVISGDQAKPTAMEQNKVTSVV